MSSQGTGTCRFGFSHQEQSKRSRNEVLNKSWKLAVLVFLSHQQSKRTRNECPIKA